MTELEQIVHGLPSRYNKGCRCDVCRKGHAERMERLRMNRLDRIAEGDPTVPHGTASCYTNWGCRCEPCREAGAIKSRELKRRRRER